MQDSYGQVIRIRVRACIERGVFTNLGEGVVAWDGIAAASRPDLFVVVIASPVNAFDLRVSKWHAIQVTKKPGVQC